MASEPNKWDYAAAGIPSPLTDEMESQQVAKQVSPPLLLPQPPFAIRVTMQFVVIQACACALHDVWVPHLRRPELMLLNTAAAFDLIVIGVKSGP